MDIRYCTNPEVNGNVDFVSGGKTEVITYPDGKKKLSVNIGKKEEGITIRKLVLLARKIISLAKSNSIKVIAFDFYDLVNSESFEKLKGKIGEEKIAQILAREFTIANYSFVRYKKEPEDGWNFIEDVEVLGQLPDSVRESFKKGLLIGEHVNYCRELTNTPGGELTPSELVRQLERNCSNNIRTTVLGKDHIKSAKMNAILAVGQGSDEEPRFLIMEYLGYRNAYPHKKAAPPIVLIGKGVTFDSGGLNTKGDHMEDMHMDMAAAAAVASAIELAAELGLKKNIVALIPIVENMPSGKSYRQGDIITTMSGITVEVKNTDAEGRLILADALTYAESYDPKLIISVATLTGAAVSALGERASAIFTRNQKLENIFRKAGEESGDYVWPLPLHEEYEADIKSDVADIANMGKTRYGGAITAATFLQQFAKNYPYVHIDIAPTMTPTSDEHLAHGAKGSPVRLLLEILEKI